MDNVAVYDIQDIKDKVTPLAIKYNLQQIWLFGSYARGTAKPNSDIDLLIDDREIVNVATGLGFFGMCMNFEAVFDKKVDIISGCNLESQLHKRINERFIVQVMKERIKIYGRI